jgi:hypothetical protein
MSIVATASKPAPVAPISRFASFVKGDIKGGDYAKAFRRAEVSTAIEQALKGNYSPLSESLALTDGKAKKARAYLAGFIAAGVHADPLQATLRKVDYKGKLDSKDNAAARATIAERHAVHLSDFFTAFDAVMAEPPKAKAPKTPAPAVDPAVVAGDAKLARDAEDAANAVTVKELDIATIVEATASAIQTGVLSDAELTMLRNALALHDADKALAAAQTSAAGFDPVAAAAAVQDEVSTNGHKVLALA